MWSNVMALPSGYVINWHILYHKIFVLFQYLIHYNMVLSHAMSLGFIITTPKLNFKCAIRYLQPRQKWRKFGKGSLGKDELIAFFDYREMV